MSNKKEAAAKERELVRLLQEYGFSGFKISGSGKLGKKHEGADVIAYRKEKTIEGRIEVRVYLFEVKKAKRGRVYIKQESVNYLLKEEKNGSNVFFALKYPYRPWRVVSLEKVINEAERSVRDQNYIIDEFNTVEIKDSILVKR